MGGIKSVVSMGYAVLFVILLYLVGIGISSLIQYIKKLSLIHILLCVYGTGQVRDRLFYADSSYLQAGCRAGAWNPMGKCASDQAIHRRRFWEQAGHSI